MNKDKSSYEPSNLEHIANIVTHAIPVIPSFYCFTKMKQLTKREIIVVSMYGMAMILIFSISALFHYFSYWRYDKLKAFFHKCDRAIIYVFIAASYTPWLSIPNSSGLSIYIICSIWILAFVGICAQLYILEKNWHNWEIFLYLFIGLVPGSIIALLHNGPGLKEFITGGIAYLSGIYFFRSDGTIPFAHAIWHVFVIAGVAWHYWGVCELLSSDAWQS